MPYALDYSAGRPTAPQVKAAGYVGVVRYVGFPGRTKCITLAEMLDMTAGGVGVALVYEMTAGDALNGRAAGQSAARAAIAHAAALGFPTSRPVYYACDTDVVTPAQFAAVLDYIRGAADIHGSPSRVGVYGEYDVIEKAAAAGVCAWFWQTRAWSGGLLSGRAHLRQEIGQVVVGGIACDRNTILASDWGQTGTTGDPPMSAAELANLTQQVADLKAYQTSDQIKAMVRGEVIVALSDPTHAYLQDELAPLKTGLAAAAGQIAAVGGQAAALTALVAALSDDEIRVLQAVASSGTTLQAAIEAAVAKVGHESTGGGVDARAVVAELRDALARGETP
jgi:hypothetical protein